MSFPFSMMAKLAWLTLMRLSEIRCLRREQVHLDQGVVRLPRAKGGARAVMLSETAWKLRPPIRGRVAARQLLGRASWVN
jgi:integrase